MLVAQLCLTLCHPWTVACRAPLSMILQARILEWVAIPFSSGSSNAGIKPGSPELHADSLSSEPCEKPITYRQDI